MTTSRRWFHMLLSALAVGVLFTVGSSAMAANLAANLQGTYAVSSVKLFANGQLQNTGNPQYSIKVTATGLTTTTVVPNIMRHIGFILKYTKIKATATTYSAGYTGKNSNNTATFVAGSSLKATLTTGGLTIKGPIKGTHSGHVFTGTLTVLLKKSA